MKAGYCTCITVKRSDRKYKYSASHVMQRHAYQFWYTNYLSAHSKGVFSLHRQSKTKQFPAKIGQQRVAESLIITYITTDSWLGSRRWVFFVWVKINARCSSPLQLDKSFGFAGKNNLLFTLFVGENYVLINLVVLNCKAVACWCWIF